jgi:hypothetical protein
MTGYVDFRHVAKTSQMRKHRSFVERVAMGQKATRSEPSACAFDNRKDRLTAVSRDVTA